jgi:heptosyltransferase-2
MADILIVAPNWIGDAVMSEPLLRVLKNSGAKITVLATPWVASVYRAIASVDAVIEANFSHGQLEFNQRRRLARVLQSRGFTHAILLPNSWKSALIPVMAGIPNRLGYKGELRTWLLSKHLVNPPRDNRPPMVKHYLELAKLMNPLIDLSHPSLQLPKLMIRESELFVSKHFEAIPNQNHYFILAPGAEYGPAKQWPADHFSDLATEILIKDSLAFIVLLGSSKDDPISKNIIENIGTSLQSRIINLCGKSTLDESMLIVSRAAGLVSNDSGIMHIGAAFQVPQVAIYGSSDPRHTPPLSPFAGIMFLGLECSPCHQRKCPLGHLNCLKGISHSSVFLELNHQTELVKAH